MTQCPRSSDHHHPWLPNPSVMKLSKPVWQRRGGVRNQRTRFVPPSPTLILPDSPPKASVPDLAMFVRSRRERRSSYRSDGPKQCKYQLHFHLRAADGKTVWPGPRHKQLCTYLGNVNEKLTVSTSTSSVWPARYSATSRSATGTTSRASASIFTVPEHHAGNERNKEAMHALESLGSDVVYGCPPFAIRIWRRVSG